MNHDHDEPHERAPRALSPADAFNGFLAATLVPLLDAWGVLEATRAEALPLAALAQRLGIDEVDLRPVVGTAVHLGVLTRSPEGGLRCEPGYWRDRGFFTWCVGGYGRLFLQLGPFLRGEVPLGALRDGNLVAHGAEQVHRTRMQATFDAVVAEIPFECVADLGCGNAGRLASLCRRWPDRTGVGIERDTDAVAAARRLLASEGVSERVELVEADVRMLVDGTSTPGELHKVDLVMCFLMLHDLFALRPPDEVMEGLMRAFPAARHFLVADTVRGPAGPPPIFQAAFELIHDVTGVTIHPEQVYLDAFRAAGLRVLGRHPMGSPNTFVYLLAVGP